MKSSDSHSAQQPEPLVTRPQSVHEHDTLAETSGLAVSEELARLLDDYLTALKAGRAPDKRQLLADNPRLATQLEACLAGLEFIQRTSDTPTPHSILGGFRILREVGRGGMGAVYEAEDLTLGRHVALKVLRFGPVVDTESLDRFRREAETVAGLHHTNIVPIFTVGSQQGVHYYVMQFIEGRSLAEVTSEGQGLAAQTVAAWGLQAAEALEHAHRRGVIHRDVKPSNLLLDAEDRIWLTDFGLAKRRDDVTLSMTGALLGTPRYMSPEQAAAAGGRVDHRTDIYSLGATLYELVTGHPAFTAETPQAVLQEILTRDPPPARARRPDIPRDLETILSKCLAKSPSARYATAADLADDLRALLDGRPIRARRASPLERLIRWGKQHRRSLTLTSTSVAATLALVLAATWAWNLRTQSQRAYLSLATTGPPLAAQLFDQHDRAATEKQSLPTHEPFGVMAGNYTIRLESAGRLSQDVQIQLPAGGPSEYPMDLDDQLLGSPRTIDSSYLVVDDPEQSRLLLLDQQGIHLRDSLAPNTWSVRLAGDDRRQFPDAPGLVWPWNGGRQHADRGWLDLRPQPAATMDLNGDGKRDYILAARHQAWVLAISGHDGQPLWLAARGKDVCPVPPDDDAPRPNFANLRPFENQAIVSTVLGPPIPLPDLNNDQVADLLITCADASPLGDVPSVRRWVEALSGRDGQTLWTHELPDEWFRTASDEAIPLDFRWFVGDERQVWPAQTGNLFLADVYVRITSKYPRRDGPFVYVPEPAQLVDLKAVDLNRGGDSGDGVGDKGGLEAATAVCLTAGVHLCLLNPRTGTPVGEPRQLPMRPGTFSKWRDVNGDGRPELIALEETPATPPAGEPQAKLFVWSLAGGSTLWQQSLSSPLPRRSLETATLPAWPLVVDLNGDGRWVVVVPNGGTQDQPPRRNRLPWGGLELRDASTGNVRWERQILTAEQHVSYFLAGPDIDGDGDREIFVASLWGAERDVYLQALSGGDGHTLWTNFHRPPAVAGYGEYWLQSMHWWTDGPDGWPQVLVQLGVDGSDLSDTQLVAFSAGSGQVTRTASGFAETQLADLDGDRVPELMGFRPRNALAYDMGGSLDIIRGVPREAWRSAGVPSQPASDLDGDGLRDLVKIWQDGTAHAICSATGNVLWRTRIRQLDGKQPRVMLVQEASSSERDGAGACDLNGDGVADILVSGSVLNSDGIHLLHALSGAAGRRLWASEATLSSVRDIPLLACHDLDSDGSPEIIAVVAGCWQRPAPANPWAYQLWLLALSSRDGRTKWKHALTTAADTALTAQFDSEWSGAAFQLRLGDCDHDGVLDLVLPAKDSTGDGVELRAVSGKDGRAIWHHALPATTDKQPVRSVPPPRVADLDGDGQAEVYLLAFEDSTATAGAAQRIAHVRCLAADTGVPQWHWKTDVPEFCGRIDSSEQKLQRRPMPYVVRRRDSEDLLAVPLWGSPGRVVLLDHHGQQVGDELVRSEWAHFPVWIQDLDADGSDELLVLDQQQLQARRTDGSGQLLWRYAYLAAGQLQLTDFLPASDHGSVTVVGFLGAPRNQLLGLDGATGSTQWTCPAPMPRTQGLWLGFDTLRVLDQVAPTSNAASEQAMGPPHALFGSAFLTCCRQAVWTDEALGTSRSTTVAVLQRDARRLRDLPWVSESRTAWQTLPRLFAWATFYSFSLVLVPVVYLVGLARYRRWSLGTLALLPVIAGVFVASLLLEPPDELLAPIPARFGWALAGVPVFLALGLLARWTWRGHGWRLASATMLLPLTTLGLAALMIGMDRWQADPTTGYNWDGWYWAIVPSGYVAACLLCLLSILIAVAQLGVRTWKRRRPSAAGSGPGQGETRP